MSSSIQEKSRDYAIRIINCYKFLTEEKKEFVMSKQLLRAGTSIGANTRESKNAQSKPDFLSKLNVALKEADETEYWLELLFETGYIDEQTYNPIQNSCGAIRRMLISSIKTIKEKSDN